MQLHSLTGMPNATPRHPPAERPSVSASRSRARADTMPDMPAHTAADLRTDHAGETGAIAIYQGVLATARDPALRSFAERHLVTERQHLHDIEAWLPPQQRSRLLSLWRLAGFVTGAVPGLWGSKAVYATVEAVETFVDRHYEDQIRRLSAQPALSELRQTLLACQADECAHRDEAAAAQAQWQPGRALRAWCTLVEAGSHAAVALSRHL